MISKKINRTLTEIWNAWKGFWFESYSPRQLELFRLGFGLLLFTLYAVRTPDTLFYFSENGFLTSDLIKELMPMEFRYSVFFLFRSEMALWIGHFVFLISLLWMAFGLKFTRVATIVAYALHLSFLRRNMAQGYGADLISAFFLFYLCLASYDRVSEKKPVRMRHVFGSVALRLIQLQVCVIYAYSGLDKVRGAQWWAGEALWGVLANAQLARFDFSVFAHFPILVTALTYSTLAWEIYFPVLIWNRVLKPWMLGFGVALHVGISVMINIPFFGVLMMLSYIVFCEDSWIDSFFRWLKAKRGRATA